MQLMNYATMKTKAKDYKRVPIYQTMLADSYTPMEILKCLQKKSKRVFLLESMENANARGRYTFLGFDPFMEVSGKDGVITERRQDGIRTINDEPKVYLEQLRQQFITPKIKELPPFTGGMVGYFSYDYVKYSEKVLVFPKKTEDDLPDFDFMLFDRIIAFDHVKDILFFIALVDTKRIDESYKKAQEDLANMMRMVREKRQMECKPGHLLTKCQMQFTKEEFKDIVEKGKSYIKEGDIFQFVPSNLRKARYEGSLLNAYRYLRTTNPSPYMFFFANSQVEIMGASPETLVKLEDGIVHTYPLAGSRPRGNDDLEDERLEKELREDEKECAEHNMLVDLGRNDIGKIAEFGSVEVEEYQQVLKFSHIMHLGSSVRGKLRDRLSPLDVMEAILPAGTLSGAPKIRAMQIIQELEKNHRDIYGGAIGYLDFTGNLDFCIGIRFAYLHKGYVYVRTGAGIVADSVPDKEYEECFNKAKAVLLALEKGEEEL
ncbi:anthranilate synthase, aminase component [Lachnospiraceae bacterium KM106-2]|nr:anthranilate synthase, aminase component [Lachnospiraceae bacterium KM106-2]